MQLTNLPNYFGQGTWLQFHRPQNSIQAIIGKHQYIQLHYNCPFYMLLELLKLIIHNLKGENSDANLWRAVTN